jgi:hypothetical protein
VAPGDAPGMVLTACSLSVTKPAASALPLTEWK